MRTRCPRCRTIFRITPEQLRARNGSVRCGHCQAVFNALESLVEAPSTQPQGPAAEVAPPPAPSPESLPEPRQEPESGSSPRHEPLLSAETPEESAQAAREIGLVAARDLTETPGYSRWASAPLAGLEPEAREQANWPFAVAACLLALTLALQGALQFRTALVRQLPSLSTLFAALNIDIPLPRQSDRVSIETSDLQADHSRGLLVLQATLRNDAPYAQAWPALELTLTDTQDTVIARRVLAAADYLPPQADPAVFPARGETALRLWIETREIAAAGYRLYLFYP